MADQQHKAPERIAIVGGGIAGIACLWGLRNTTTEVHLYEADAYLGGHSHSFTLKNDKSVATVDTGFIVSQEDMYRMFLFSSLCFIHQ
jgi:predicted NAD/FAD-binding protein